MPGVEDVQAPLSPGSAIATFCVYTFLVLVVAWLSHRRLSGRSFLSEYYLGSRGLGVIAFTLTFAATSASAGSFAGLPALLYAHGWAVALWIAGYMVVPLCAMGLLAKRLNQMSRATGAITLPDVLRERFASRGLAALATGLIICLLSVYLIPQFKLASLILKQLLGGTAAIQAPAAYLADLQTHTGWFQGVDAEYLLCLGFFSIVVVAYTTVGGFRAVVWTDVMQGLIMLVGIVMLMVLTIRQAGGLGAATRELAEQTPPRLGHVLFTLDSPRDTHFRLPSDMWIRLHHPNDNGEQSRTLRTNEPVLITAGNLVSAPTRAVEVTWQGNRSGKVPARIDDLPDGVQVAEAGPFEAYQGGSGEREAYVRAPGPSFDSVNGFLPLGIAFSFFIYWPLSGAGQPGNMVRLMAFDSARTLRRSIALLAVLFTVIYGAIVITFCSARAIVPGLDSTPDRIMPVLSFQVATAAGIPWLAGVLVAVPFSAAMSTVDSFMLMISSAVVRDLYQRNVNPQASEKLIKRLSYLCMIVVGLVVTIGAMNPPRMMQYLIVFAGGGLASAFLAPVTLALYSPRASAHSATASMLTGLGVYLGLYLIGIWTHEAPQPLTLLSLDPLIWSVTSSFLVGIAINRILPQPSSAVSARFFN